MGSYPEVGRFAENGRDPAPFSVVVEVVVKDAVGLQRGFA